MTLLLSVPNGAAGAQIELDSPATGPFLSRVVDLSGVPDPAFGAQTSWAINPGTGSDSGPGTPAEPLRTQAEFNRRMAAPMLVTVAATLQLVGDVVDAPLWLRGTAFAAGASLTVSGTATAQTGVATITLVTSLNTAGAGTLQPWQLQTTGKDWTTVALGSRLLLSNGSQGFIRNVIDANNVVVGALSTTALTTVTPTAGLTITLQTLSRALPSNVDVQAVDSTAVVTVQLCSFDTGNLTGRAPAQGNILFFGCEIKAPTGTTTLTTVGGMQVRGCRFTMAAGSPVMTFRSAAGILNIFSTVWSGATTATVTPNSPGHHQWQHACLLGAQVLVQGSALLQVASSFNIQHTTTAVRLDTMGQLNAGITIVTGSAGAGTGIDVRCGIFIWLQLANRPTITGANDCAVAGVVYTYAALGSGKTAALLDAIPPTVTPVGNTDPNRGPGIATLAQSG